MRETFIEILHLIESTSIVYLIFSTIKKYTHTLTGKIIPVVFLIDISNTPKLHIHTRLRSHFNQMWHILALTCILYLCLSLTVFFVSVILHWLVSIALLLFIRWNILWKFLTHNVQSSRKRNLNRQFWFIWSLSHVRVSRRLEREWTEC